DGRTRSIIGAVDVQYFAVREHDSPVLPELELEGDGIAGEPGERRETVPIEDRHLLSADRSLFELHGRVVPSEAEIVPHGSDDPGRARGRRARKRGVAGGIRRGRNRHEAL